MARHWPRLQRSQESDDVLFLLRKELQLEHHVEEFHSVVQRKQPIVVQVGRRVLDARSGNVLIGPSADALRPLIVTSLKNRSVRKLCIKLSV